MERSYTHKHPFLVTFFKGTPIFRIVIYMKALKYATEKLIFYKKYQLCKLICDKNLKNFKNIF